MNKEYIYIDDKVEVKDEFDKTKKVDYSDNIEEILIKENIIEQIELEQKKLLNEKKHNKNINFKLLKKAIFTLLSIPIVLIVLPLITGIMELIALPIIGCILATIIPVYLSLFLIYEYNKTNKINKGINSRLNYLENELKKEKENFEKLKQNKSKQDAFVKVPVSKRVDDIKELKRLKEKLLIYYNCGYNQDKYTRYLNQGKLNDRLNKTFNEEQINIIEDFLLNSSKIKILENKI